LALVDAQFNQSGRLVARATALFLDPKGSPSGDLWEPGTRSGTPPGPVLRVADGQPPRAYRSVSLGWGALPCEHSNAEPKQSWHASIPIVAGEVPSDLERVASIADVANVVTGWGSLGLAYINGDVTVNFVRGPDGPELGLAAIDRYHQGGIGVGVAELFDRRGAFGLVVVSAVAARDGLVDPSGEGRSLAESTD
jgi:hypothetical protein